MLFNSFVFLAYLSFVLVAYWALRSRKLQNIFLLTASLFFYAWGEQLLVALILVCGLTGYLAGVGIERFPSAKRSIVITGSGIALGFLFVFKYFDFFVSSVAATFEQVGLPFQSATLRLALPIGISFFTFQTVGYMLDVYRGEVKAEHNLIDFLLFVTFFPQLVAGPIERATNLLPQVKNDRSVNGDDILSGTYMTLQGYVKKVVIADNLSPIVDTLFATDSLSGPLVAVGTLAFAFQIYCDFSGYTDIARGISRMMGFHILLNFNHPYVSKTPSEFWRRWHITLSEWFRDYVYIPLGGSRLSPTRTQVNLFITMVVSGLWHGASANFILWGAYWGVAVGVHKLFVDATQSFRASKRKAYQPLAWAGTFAITLYGWLLFRVESWEKIVSYTGSLVTDWSQLSVAIVLFGQILFYIAIVIALDAIESRAIDVKNSQIQIKWISAPYFAALLLLVLVFGAQSGGSFIYFRF